MRVTMMTFAFTLIASLFIYACKDLLTDPFGYGPGVIYANSFESPADTVGWKLQGEFSFNASVPPGGGLQSIRVAGGCIVPHASKRITTGLIAGKIALRCWGKCIANGGSVEIWRVADRSTRIWVGISDTTWRPYQTTTSLDCVAGDELEIDMNSGGIVYGAMLVDSLRVFLVGGM